MYAELYAAWQREIENAEISPLPPEFYSKVSDYIKRIKEESRATGKKDLKAVLIEHELLNVERLVQDLIWIRFRKLKKTINEDQKMHHGILTPEEEKAIQGFMGFTQAYHALTKSLLQGETAKTKKEESSDLPHRRVAVRFLKPIPAIIGSDMQTYGPFATEDVGSLPVENARILVKQGLAAIIDTS